MMVVVVVGSWVQVAAAVAAVAVVVVVVVVALLPNRYSRCHGIQVVATIVCLYLNSDPNLDCDTSPRYRYYTRDALHHASDG